MQIKDKKTILEVYGLFRMCFGLFIFISLLSGYFLNEWIIKYPSNVFLNFFNEEIIALVSLATIFRALFNFFAGIGTARLKSWVRIWIFSGWPIMIIISFGLAYSFFSQWSQADSSIAFYNILSFPKILLYFCMLVFDWFFVSRNILLINADNKALDGLGGRIELKKISIVIFVVIFLFSCLMFLGKPLKQGFHKGYYKIKEGQENKSRVSSKKSYLKSSTEFDQRIKNNIEKQNNKMKNEIIISGTRETVELLPEAKVLSEKETPVKAVRKQKINDGIPYVNIVGYFAVFCMISSLVFQIFEAQKIHDVKSISMPALLFMSLSFLILIVFGISIKIPAIYIMGFLCSILSMILVFLKIKYSDDHLYF